MSTYWCVVPAAGRGSRFGSKVPKQYLRLGDKPMLLHTLERLAAHPYVAGLMLVVAADDTSWAQGLFEVLGKPLLRATGGAERADSVLAGLRALPASVEAEDFVLVHDAARPCLRSADVSRLIEQAAPAGGGLLAAPLRDTLKLAGADGRVAATESREARWRALTPQLFRRGELETALAAAVADGVSVSDEAMAMERSGFAPLLVEGAEDNIKVTTAADLALAEYLLSKGVLV
ncbi:2-C-methyl-D-erythritol 4-phosphate cytidylyltransferase [Tahibacter harae]|uniref:2-C-methyl-D-erythritol 4-phosphate cytidylyltransferase n=1 Tax=Tahibacter harae TaxID=2963937 RepID=A0ABT1QWR9_9GAMM|nr:2-C-methyl-D-erythritol 4-phosphate cytidylyltransferase [Tahibacter harae]MCQ4166728.1 2-C-methyl-D-erythritol 4-phosphate cytidylyltransferase [Tahibacter harae]